MTKKTTFSYPSLFQFSFLLLVFLLTACNADEVVDATNQIDAAKAQLVSFDIDAPFENISNASEALIIENPAEATSFQLASGGYINVPANAFQNASGEVVTETVKLVYKDYQTASSIIAAGIPMQVANEDGTVDWMQTGGMFEVRGYVKDEAVDLVANKPIEVSIVSTTSGDFDVWEFDEAAGNWEGIAQNYQATKEVIKNEQLEQEITQLRQATASQPVNPATKGRYKLLFNDLDLSNCPKLKGKSTIALVYVGTDKAKDPKSKPSINTPGVWYKKELKPLDAAAGTYTLTLFGEELYQIPVTVALQGAELEAAKARYQTLLAQHQQQVAILKDKIAQRQLQNSFRRTMRATGMGIYNYDIRYFKEATGLVAEFNFGVEGNQYKNEAQVYLITADNSVVVALNGGRKQPLRYYPEEGNKLIAVLPGDLIATFSESDFEAAADELLEATLGNETYVFHMNLRSGSVKSVADLQAIIDKISDGTPLENIAEATPITNSENTTANPVSPAAIRLFPNPVNDLLNINLAGFTGQRGQLSINNQMGQRVQAMTIDKIEETPVQLQIGTLTSGTYYLTVVANGDFVATKKVLKL